MHDSSSCPVCRGLSINGFMTDAEFASFVAACHDELVDKQGAFQASISDADQWSFEMLDGSITIGGTRFPMVPIGTFSPQHQTWVWGWANEDFPALARDSSCRLQRLNDLTGFQVFLDPGFPASPSDVNDLVAMAVHQLGAKGFFRCPSDGPTLYLAILD